jgi:hypothetical protein
MQNLDFESLNKSFDGELWCDTFAYWLLVLYDASSLYARDAYEAQGAMSYQYDVEEQGNLEGNSPEGRLIPDIFMPIAPVTLALRWSPFPTAIKALGQPLHIDIKQSDTLAVFMPQVVPETLGLTLDEQHFSFLLHHACVRALKENALILLVGTPGWSYDSETSEDFLMEEPEIRKLMEDIGFVCTLRKPKNA